MDKRMAAAAGENQLSHAEKKAQKRAQKESKDKSGKD
jgi:hypothetical protein